MEESAALRSWQIHIGEWHTMKDVAMILATILVIFSLLALLSADYNRDSASFEWAEHDPERITESGHRFAFQR